RGMWGVEPMYPSNNFYVEPDRFTVKRGDPGANGGTDVTEPYVTREYQICLKCHSNYGYDQPPMLGVSTVTTMPGTNAMYRYTNQAREYNSPDSHKGEFGSGGGSCVGSGMGLDGGADAAYNCGNHRSWHPVMNNTGREPFVRNADANNWISPFNNAVGTQTMYCSDCHGSDTAPGTADPDPGQENGPVWGPHGSTNNFLLKGPWSADRVGGTGETAYAGGPTYSGGPLSAQVDPVLDHLCFKCHDFNQYANPFPPVVQPSGFGGNGPCLGCGLGNDSSNYHTFHALQVSNFRCNFCHVAVPHGWKNKAFLVNLNDVGSEAGFPGPGNQVRNGTLDSPVSQRAGYTQGPYYNRAVLKIASFARSGEWQDSNCGSAGSPGNGLTGIPWMMGHAVYNYNEDGSVTYIAYGEGCIAVP
ncbi:MAG: hypothetical protein GXP17_02830, partial [Gammaproteobacteria bacterium]|nr:hypothetical protein [Gammaproteobacteria bacterium]